MQKRRARRPASVQIGLSGCPLPAGAVAAAVAGARVGAGTRARAVGVLGDDEVVARLRLRRDDVGLSRARRRADLADGGAVVETGVAEVRGRDAVRVGLLLRVAGLDLRDEVTGVGLGLTVLTL